MQTVNISLVGCTYITINTKHFFQKMLSLCCNGNCFCVERLWQIQQNWLRWIQI